MPTAPIPSRRFVQLALTSTPGPYVYALDNYGQLWRLLTNYPEATWEALLSQPWEQHGSPTD